MSRAVPGVDSRLFLYDRLFGADAVPGNRVIASSQAAMTPDMSDDLPSAILDANAEMFVMTSR